AADSLPVLAEGQALDELLVAFENHGLRARFGVPYPHAVVLTAGGNAPTVRTKSHAYDRASVSPEGERLLAAAGIPHLRKAHLRSAVKTAGHDTLAIRAEGHAAVSLESKNLLPGRRVPDQNSECSIGAAGDAPAVRAEDHAGEVWPRPSVERKNLPG